MTKHFNLPKFKHHDATEDAVTCAKIFLRLMEHDAEEIIQDKRDDISEFKGLVKGILTDDEVDYKEAYELLYWLEDHNKIARQHHNLYLKTREVLEDDYLDRIEANEMKVLLKQTLSEIL